MRKICVVITARASYCRVKTLLDAITRHPMLDLQIVVMEEEYNKNGPGLRHMLADDNHFVAAYCQPEAVCDGLSGAPIRTANLITQLAPIFEKLRPDVVVTIADRYETLATAITASYMHIPLAHIQGGEHSGNIDEKVRHAVTRLADLHFVATTAAQDRLIAMQENPKHIFCTGCPAIDLAWRIRDYPNECHYEIPEMLSSKQSQFTGKNYIILMQHPVTYELAKTQSQMLTTLSALQKMDIPIFIFAPNHDPGHQSTQATIAEYLRDHSHLPFYQTSDFPPDLFLRFLYNASCIVGNSSVGIREASVLGVPAVNIGSRQQGRERSINVIDVDHSSEAIADAIQYQIQMGRYPPSHLYGSGNAGEQTAQLLATEALTIFKKPILNYAHDI